jgi:ribosome biogenesis protein Nip4
MIEEFISKFSGKIEGYRKIGYKYYLVDNTLFEVSKKIDSDIESIGTYLGEEKKGKFFPSVALIDMISASSTKRVILTGKAEWMFLCGRDAFKKSIYSCTARQGEEVIVFNERGEVLGLGKVTDVGIKNILDKGDFLRREKKKNQ